MRTLIVVVGLTAFAVAPSALSPSGQDARTTLTVGTASAERGKLAYGELQVPQGSERVAVARRDDGTDVAAHVCEPGRPAPLGVVGITGIEQHEREHRVSFL